MNQLADLPTPTYAGQARFVASLNSGFVVRRQSAVELLAALAKPGLDPVIQPALLAWSPFAAAVTPASIAAEMAQ